MTSSHTHNSISGWIVLGAIVGLTYQTFQLMATKPFRSFAKLIASDRFMAFTAEDDGVTDYEPSTMRTCTATIIETIESAEMQRRALERTRALHPALAESDVQIIVRQVKDSAIFNVIASGSEGAYIRTYLNALLDEFIAFRQAVRSQNQARFFERWFDEFEERRAEAVKTAALAGREPLEAAYRELFERLARYKTVTEDASHLAIFERASASTPANKDWASSLGLGAVLGIFGGMALGSLAQTVSTRRSVPP